MTRRFFGSIFKKLILSFVVVFIPMYLLSFYLYWWSQKTVSDEITRSVAQQSEFYLKSLEREFANVHLLLYQCVDDDNLQNLAVFYPVLNDYEKYLNIKGLHQNMVRIKNSSPYLKNVSVHLKEPLRTIGANRTVDDMSFSYYEDLKKAIDTTAAPFYNDNGRIFFSNELRSKLREPLYLLDAELDLEALGESLSQFDSYQGSGSVLAGLASGALFSGDDAANVGEKMERLSSSQKEAISVVWVDDAKYLLVQSASKELGLTLVHYVPTREILTPLSWLTIWLVVLTFTILLLTALFFISTRGMIQKPLNILVNSFECIESNDFSNRIEITRHDEFGYLYRRYNEMLDRLNELIDQNYRNKILAQEAQVKQLQSQINPHFLYNSLFLINTMAKTGDDNLIPFSQYLGSYFRFMTRNARDILTLEEEIGYARNYAKLQEMRFKKRLTMHFDELPGEYAKIKIPRLTIQPIIENAFEYVVEKTADRSILNILFEAETERLCIIVEDSGSTLCEEAIDRLAKDLQKENDNDEVTGLRNVHRRLMLFYGSKAGIKVSRSSLGGLRVSVGIPFREQGRELED